MGKCIVCNPVDTLQAICIRETLMLQLRRSSLPLWFTGSRRKEVSNCDLLQKWRSISTPGTTIDL